jgi:CheY-like chemotaxis protein
VLNDILDLSKIESGKLAVEQIECCPSDMVADVANLMKARADAKGLSLKLEHDGPIPETIRTDPTRLRQILLNLVGNAVKFTEQGSVRLVTKIIQHDAQQPLLQFEIIDTGIGMDVSQAASLFQPFTQADTSTTRKFGGTGLGLTISRRLARILGGDTAASGVPGEGSTFRVTIATGCLDGVKLLDDPYRADSPDVAPRHGNRNKSSRRLNCRVLLAEDGPDNQRLISFLLTRAGAEVTLAENGQRAIELAQAATNDEQPFDVILMDMQMPILDGYDATRQLRASGYQGPIAALTAHAMSGDREKCVAAGCDHYITKPLKRDELLDLVHEMAGGNSAEISPTTSATMSG